MSPDTSAPCCRAALCRRQSKNSWRWRESNPRPKTPTHLLLHAYPLNLILPCHAQRGTAMLRPAATNFGCAPRCQDPSYPDLRLGFHPFGIEADPRVALKLSSHSYRFCSYSFFRLFNECPRLRPRRATRASAPLSIPSIPKDL